jgi:hypothetical protein
MNRVRRVKNQQELEHLIDDFITRGYILKSQSETEAQLKAKNWGDSGIHLFLLALTGWWTFGLSNALYGIYKRGTAEEVHIRVVDESNDNSHQPNLKAAGAPTSDLSVNGSCSTTDQPEVASYFRSSSAIQTNYGDSDWLSDRRSNGQTADERFTEGMIESHPIVALLQLLSLFVAVFVLCSIFALHTGLIRLQFIGPVLLMIASWVGFRYIFIYYPFLENTYRRLFSILSAVVVIGVTWITARQLVIAVSTAEFQELIHAEIPREFPTSFLPEWWSGIILTVAAVFFLIGSIRLQLLQRYIHPTEIWKVPLSPPYFGFGCAFFGLWAVLFVGISVQRIIIIAPIFEELLKFGVALLVGSTLFDRSLAARIGVAVVVGTSFGLIEHATTYSAEPDFLYLFRTLFHATTTVLSISVYTVWESDGETTLLWIAPIYSMWIHFFNNTFAVISAIIFAFLSEPIASSMAPVYSFLTVIVTIGLVIFTLLRHRVMKFLTRMFATTFLPSA